ncbi:MAG: YgjV family protein [Ruminococcaceae bacterium]|nr:YgjV family protein [Oscillospiraceae bacterium]
MNIPVHLLGLGAMVSLFLIYQQKDRRRILLCKLSADVFWIAHYFLLGATAGMIPNLVGIFRELVFINRGKKKWASTPLWAALFILINLTLGILSFDIWYDIIPIVASSFVTISLWINNPTLTKLITLPVCAAFLTYDLFVGSYMGILNESISIVSIILFFIKKSKGDKRHA